MNWMASVSPSGGRGGRGGGRGVDGNDKRSPLGWGATRRKKSEGENLIALCSLLHGEYNWLRGGGGVEGVRRVATTKRVINECWDEYWLITHTFQDIYLFIEGYIMNANSPAVLASTRCVFGSSRWKILPTNISNMAMTPWIWNMCGK